MTTLTFDNNIVILGRSEQHSIVEFDSKQITIQGKVSGQRYKRTFKVGDLVEYDSDYQGSKYGKLQRIYKDNVLIVDREYVCRIPLYEFAKRNWDFNDGLLNAGI